MNIWNNMLDMLKLKGTNKHHLNIIYHSLSNGDGYILFLFKYINNIYKHIESTQHHYKTSTK